METVEKANDVAVTDLIDILAQIPCAASWRRVAAGTPTSRYETYRTQVVSIDRASFFALDRTTTEEASTG